MTHSERMAAYAYLGDWDLEAGVLKPRAASRVAALVEFDDEEMEAMDPNLDVVKAVIMLMTQQEVKKGSHKVLSRKGTLRRDISLAAIGARVIKIMLNWGRRIMWGLGRFFIRFLVRSILLPLGGMIVGMVGVPTLIVTAMAAAAAYALYWLFDKEGAQAQWDRIWGPSGEDYGRTDTSGIATSSEVAYEHASVDAAGKQAGHKLLAKRSATVKEALAEAARVTGVDEGILTAFAYKESGFNPKAKAPTSSAAGLMQFLTGTWHHTLTRYGKQYGVAQTASRYDPLASAIMGGAYIKHEIAPSISRVVGTPTVTDLYLGHFMGPGGGSSWLRRYKADPNRAAALDFPKAAASNRWVYWDRAGNFRSYAQIYGVFARDLTRIEAAVTEENTVVPPIPVPVQGPPPVQTVDIAGPEHPRDWVNVGGQLVVVP